eukprot:RCo040786
MIAADAVWEARCLEYQVSGIPAEKRLEAWQHFLSVDSAVVSPPRPEDFVAAAVNVHSIVRDDCERLTSEVLGGVRTQQELCGLLGMLCVPSGGGRPTFPYSSELRDLVTPPLLLGFPLPAVYMLVVVVQQKFLLKPLSLHAEDPSGTQCVTQPTQPLCTILRLLLQYHDPALCLHLDTHRVAPAVLWAPWGPRLFVGQAGPALVVPIWDHLFLGRDPSQSCFLGLALLTSHRESLLAISDPEALLSALQGLRLPDGAAVTACIDLAGFLFR